MEKEDFKWKLGIIFYDLAEGKIGVCDAYERYDVIENEKVLLPQSDVIGSLPLEVTNLLKQVRFTFSKYENGTIGKKMSEDADGLLKQYVGS